MSLASAVGGLLFLILALLAYVLLGLAIVGGTFLATALCTGVLVAAPSLAVVQRAPAVRRGFFSLTDSFFGRYPTSLRDRAFLTVYVGVVGLYSVGCLVVLAQVLTAVAPSSTSYPPNQPVVLLVLAAFLVGLIAVVRSGRLHRFGPRVRSLLEWGAFAACVTVLGVVVVFETLLLVLKVSSVFY